MPFLRNIPSMAIIGCPSRQGTTELGSDVTPGGGSMFQVPISQAQPLVEFPGYYAVGAGRGIL